MEEQKMLEALQKPFEQDEIEWRIGAKNREKTKGIALAYISNRAIQKRLDDVCGIFNWKNEFREWKGKEQLCGISIKVEGEWITKWDGASDTDFESTKGGLSGAMKRAAVQWGIGRYLYDIPNQWVKIKPQGKSYNLNEIPKLPTWALPTFKKQEPSWDDKSQEFEIPKNIQKCINAFSEYLITQSDLENYLCKEAFMFDEKDIQSVKIIYAQLRKGIKTKDDFFNIENNSNKEKSIQTKGLEQRLENLEIE